MATSTALAFGENCRALFCGQDLGPTLTRHGGTLAPVDFRGAGGEDRDHLGDGFAAAGHFDFFPSGDPFEHLGVVVTQLAYGRRFHVLHTVAQTSTVKEPPGLEVALTRSGSREAFAPTPKLWEGLYAPTFQTAHREQTECALLAEVLLPR